MSLGKGLGSLIVPSGSGGNHQKPASSPAPSIRREVERPSSTSTPRVSHPSPSRNEPYQDVHRPEAIFHIETEKIVSNPYQPRKIFNEEELRDLTDSIREHGIIQPLVVSKAIKNTDHGTIVEYQLIAGERRLKAARKAGLPRVPVIIRKSATPKMKLELALIENIQRSNLNAIESARAYSRLQDEFGLTQKDIAIRVGKSRESVANTMRLLNLPAYIQDAIAEGKISESQARNLLSLSDPEEQHLVFERMREGKMSVRKAREHIAERHTPNPERSYWEKRLEEKFGVPISIVKQGTRGKLTIQFYSDEEFQSLLHALLEGEME